MGNATTQHRAQNCGWTCHLDVLYVWQRTSLGLFIDIPEGQEGDSAAWHIEALFRACESWCLDGAGHVATHEVGHVPEMQGIVRLAMY